MGVDWIPCRLEEGCNRDEISELVRREAMHFRTTGSSHVTNIDPRIQFSNAEREQIHQSYMELGPLYQHLLVKYYVSHRVSVIRGQPLLPIEWRIEAERTILPWELEAQLAIWQGYRDEVANGQHESYLRQLYIYDQILSLASVEVANFLWVVESSLTTTGSWANRQEVAACRDEILAGEILTLPPPPQWPDGGGESDTALVEQAYTKVEAVIGAWNTAVQRGNKRIRFRKQTLNFDEWVATHLNNEWYTSFLAWVEPWKQGGYGLYRDCE